MRARIRLVALACTIVFVGQAEAAPTRELSVEDRIRAQKAVERVYFSHQVGTTRSFEEAFPRTVLERRVRNYLKQSAELEVFWHTRVSAVMLDGELRRIHNGSRMPDRLREVFAALGNDPVLIKECVARATLVDRLSRASYSSDATIHEDSRRSARELRERLVDGDLDPTAARLGRTVTVIPRASASTTSEEFANVLGRFDGASGSVGPIEETTDAFRVRVLLGRTSDELRVATFAVPKRSYEDWRNEVDAALDETGIRTVASDDRHVLADAAFPAASDSWRNGSLDAVPEGRALMTAVWTGTEMIVWGGIDGDFFNDGSRYDPATDTWSPISRVKAPDPRALHTAIWTGTEMIVWGGYRNDRTEDHDFATGGRYDPVTDTWEPTSKNNAPDARRAHSAVWTGTKMIVWGGYFFRRKYRTLDTGGIYDPSTDSWAPISSVGAPSARSGHVAAWTGTRMVVWGGSLNFSYLDTGGIYDPASDSWESTTPHRAPSARKDATAVWTGSKMIVWGGNGRGGATNTGAQYDPVLNLWKRTSTIDAPAPRYAHIATWTGDKMMVWGGYDGSVMDSGGIYDPAGDTWVSTTTVEAPEARSRHAAVWTGGELIVWGGDSSSHHLQTGGRYSLSADSWTPTAVSPAPEDIGGSSAVWTGNAMIVWGGTDGVDLVATGSRYDPVTDTWTPTSVVATPSARTGHSAVWTGSEMIVWGGSGDTGGRYDPIADSWIPTSLAGAPSGHEGHTAIWTGTELIVWGGFPFTTTGGRYDPRTDTWTPTSLSGAPSARWHHTAVWTGSEMVVWGGDGSGYTATGARYDPSSDAWTPTSTVAAPAARSFATAVWTGSEMIVWGGTHGSAETTGGKYSPANDAWTPTATAGAPSARWNHSAVWTGSEVVVWGGQYHDHADIFLDSGSRYDPASDTWTATSSAGSPNPREGHTAVWTGIGMIVWSGYHQAGAPAGNGGCYLPGP